MALTDKLTAIADAIRSKGGTTDQLTLAGMVDAYKHRIFAGLHCSDRGKYLLKANFHYL